MMYNKCEFLEEFVSEIIPGLWLGNYESSINNDFLNNNNITHIIRIFEKFEFDINNKDNIKRYNVKKINISPNVKQSDNIYLFKYEINNFIYHHFPYRDIDFYQYNLNNMFNYTNLIIKNGYDKGENILVHCKMGHHRSATVVAAFIMKYLNINYIDTVSYINHIRKCSLRRDTCMVKGLIEYYKKII